MPVFGRGKDCSSSGLKARLSRLVHEEDGALILFSIQIFLIMMVCTGLAIDIMRAEERRSLIQNTLDRAALAAASLSQTLDPEVVVRDYLTKAGLDYLDINPKIEEGNFREWRRVTISAKDRMPTIFGPHYILGPYLGVTELSAAGASQAMESIGNVEISMVLDISGSMTWNIYHDGDWRYSNVYPTRMDNLRSAALNFVDRMFETVQPPTAPAGRLSISIVPYNQQVVLGSRLGSIYNLSTDHTRNTCADVQDMPTSTIGISPTQPLTRTMYGWQPDYYEYGWSYIPDTSSDDYLSCFENSKSAILAFANDKTAIKSMINGLVAWGGTAIDTGARWGLALLDPAARPALNTMISKNWASSRLGGRPFDYDDGTQDLDHKAMKVLILMTDGDNSGSRSMPPEYRTGPSPFRSTRSSTAFSNGSYDWNELYYYDPSRSKPYYSFRYSKWYYAYQLPSNIYTIDWATVWDNGKTTEWTLNTFMLPPRRSIKSSTTISQLMDEFAQDWNAAAQNTNLSALCQTAKDKSREVVIFTVGVNASPTGKEILRKCATADTYAYDVNAAGLTDAFASIASAINSLRLTN